MKTRRNKRSKLHYTSKKNGGGITPKYKADNVVEYIDGTEITIIEQLSYKNGEWQYKIQFPDKSYRIIPESSIKRFIRKGDFMTVRVREHERELAAFAKEHPNWKRKSKPKAWNIESSDATSFEEHQKEAHAAAVRAYAKEQLRKKESREQTNRIKKKTVLTKDLRNERQRVPSVEAKTREQPDLSKIDNMSSKNKDTNEFKWVKTPDGWVKIEEPKVDEKIEEPKVDEKIEEPTVEEKIEEPKVEEKIEESKVDEKIEESKVDEQSTSYMSAAQNERNVVPDNFAFRLSRHNDPPSSVPYFCPKECLEKIEKINDIVKKNDIKNQEDHKNITEDIKKLKNTVELRDDINQKEHAYIKTNVNELRDEIKEAFVKIGNVVDDQLKIKSDEINKLRKDINEALSNINKKVNHIDKKVRDLSEMVRDENSSTPQPIYRNVGPYNIEEDENLDYEDIKRLRYLESLGYGMPSSLDEAQLWLANLVHMKNFAEEGKVFKGWINSWTDEDRNYWNSIFGRTGYRPVLD